ncbi:MAG: chromosome partitioning protein ParB [Acidobacteria bacterium]|nr:MAG: chromosome partitioning protein ParB [Acidobacteriota bacterium]
MTRKALGRGLGALLPEVERVEAPPTEIDIDQIDPNPVQPRLHLDPKALDELGTSIRENGVLQPVLVRPLGGRFQLIAGERRLAAAQRAGLLRIPAVVRAVPDEKLLELALTENIQREQLNPIEEAHAYQGLLDTLGLTQEELALRIGKERSTIANAVRLLKLPSAVKLLVAEGKLSAGHARALLSAGLAQGEAERAAALVVERGWSVRETERWAGGRAGRPRPETPQDPNVAAAVDRLRRLLGTKVEINRGPKGSGTIRIQFFSDEDLTRIYGLLVGKGV